ncbi:hypothetical protein AB0H69_48805 [Streptomyces phaeochromogenes]|uniref:hypothetical protein n=1 Tax=Streptomyces phaeochromogenes TaxID=1923 RepID=UPI0033D59FF5
MPVYTAPTEEALDRFAEFADAWGRKYPACSATAVPERDRVPAAIAAGRPGHSGGASRAP